MSFDGLAASTLDVFDVPGTDPNGASTWRSQRPKRVRVTASTIDFDLVQEARIRVSPSSIELIAPSQLFSVESDVDEFRTWLDRTGLGAVLEEVARQFARHVGVTALRAVLETEAEEPTAQRVLLIAPVTANRSDEALQELFAFTSSPWWLSIVRATRNAVVVDIQAT